MIIHLVFFFIKTRFYLIQLVLKKKNYKFLISQTVQV